MSTNTHPDWTFDLAKRTATHRSGLVLEAKKISAGQYQVQPRQDSLPSLGPELSPADRQHVEQLIGQRVTEGGQLLAAKLSLAN